MNFRLTGILALIAAVLGLLILFWDRDEDNDQARLERARRAFRFDPARVDRVLIEASGLAIECRRLDRHWQLVQPLVARADPIAIERLLGALQEIPRGDILLPPRRAPDAYVPYGLDKPFAAISLISGPATNRILVGRRTPLGDGVYVRQSDHAGLARLPMSLLDLIPASAASLRDRSLLTGAPAAIERLDIRTPSGYLQLARDDRGSWRIFQPFTARADAATLAGLVEKLLACSVVRFVQDGASDLSPYGLDNRSAVTAVLNTDSGNGSQMLAFGDALPDDPDLVYARLQAENSIYAVPAGVREALLVRPDDLRDRRIPGLDPDSIRRVRVEEAEAVLEFYQEDGAEWQLAAPLRAPADPEVIDKLLRSWADVRLVAFENPAATNPPPAFSRTLRIVSRDPSAPDAVLRLGPCPQDAAGAGIAIEGDSTVAVAAPRILLDFPLDPLLYQSREILSLPPEDVTGLRIASGGRTLQASRDPATGQWTPGEAAVDPVLAVLASLRAVRLLATSSPDGLPAEFNSPYLSLIAHLQGQSGLAVTLLVGDELSPGGPRRAVIRGRDLLFSLSPETVQQLLALLPPETE